MPLLYALGFYMVAWFIFTIEPFFDPTWFYEMTGLSKLESSIAGLLFFVGGMLGAIAQETSRVAKAHDKLVDKLYGHED
jgi:hypothetical protein